jgi:four helix bundle protein
MEIKTFRDIIAWQKAHELVLIIYKAVKYLPSEERYNLISQMLRAAVSVAANIAEGFCRIGLADSLKFYNIAEASLGELKYYIILCRDLNYFNDAQYNYLNSKAEEVGKVLNGWIKSQAQHKND